MSECSAHSTIQERRRQDAVRRLNLRWTFTPVDTRSATSTVRRMSNAPAELTLVDTTMDQLDPHDPTGALMAALDDDDERTTRAVGFAGLFNVGATETASGTAGHVSQTGVSLAAGMAKRLFDTALPLPRRLVLAQSASALPLATAPLAAQLESGSDDMRTIAALA